MELLQKIAAVVAAHPFGTASAVKRGRNPKWPYVPIIDFGFRPGSHQQTEQIRGKAFETSAEAVAYAQMTIDWRKADMAKKLADPCQRAFREQMGLPREIR